MPSPMTSSLASSSAHLQTRSLATEIWPSPHPTPNSSHSELLSVSPLASHTPALVSAVYSPQKPSHHPANTYSSLRAQLKVTSSGKPPNYYLFFIIILRVTILCTQSLPHGLLSSVPSAQHRAWPWYVGRFMLHLGGGGQGSEKALSGGPTSTNVWRAREQADG